MCSWGYGEGLPKKWGGGLAKKKVVGNLMGKLGELRKAFSDTVAVGPDTL